MQILRNRALGIPLLRQHNVVWAAQRLAVAAERRANFRASSVDTLGFHRWILALARLPRPWGFERCSAVAKSCGSRALRRALVTKAEFDRGVWGRHEDQYWWLLGKRAMAKMRDRGEAKGV